MTANQNARSRADEYRTKAEGCRVQAERASGDRRRTWLELAERWSAAADQVQVSLAGLDAEHDQDLFAGGVDGRQDSPMQDIAPKLKPPMRQRRSGMIACGVSALVLGLIGGVSLHRTLDRDQTAAGLRQTGRGTNTPGSVEQTLSRAAVRERAENGLRADQARAGSKDEAQEVVLGGASNRSSAEQLEDRVERVGRPSNVAIASPTAKPVVQDASGNTNFAAELPAAAKDKASVKPTSKDLPLNTETKAIDANWSVSGRM